MEQGGKAETVVKMHKASRSHHEAEIAELAANRELAAEYLRRPCNRWTIPKIARRACWRCAGWPKPMAARRGRG
jgi:hypothetical protein